MKKLAKLGAFTCLLAITVGWLAGCASSNRKEKTESTHKMLIAFDETRTVLLAIEEELKSTYKHEDIVKHAEELEESLKKILDAATPFSSSEFELIRRDVSEIQHIVHELEHAAKEDKHEEVHHSAENLDRHLDALERDIKELQASIDTY